MTSFFICLTPRLGEGSLFLLVVEILHPTSQIGNHFRKLFSACLAPQCEKTPTALADGGLFSYAGERLARLVLRASKGAFYAFQEADLGLVEGLHEGWISDPVMDSHRL